MNVYVDADARLTAGDSHHEICAFRSDALKREQRFGLARQRAFIFIDCASRDPEDLLRFAFMKCTGADQLIDFTRCEPADFERRARLREKSSRCRDGHFVTRADRDDAGYELFERGTEAVVVQFEHRGLGEWANRRPDAADHLVNVERPLAVISFKPHFLNWRSAARVSKRSRPGRLLAYARGTVKATT